MTIALPKAELSGDLKDLDEKVKTMIGRRENMIKYSSTGMCKSYVCQICGKKGQWVTITDHIEANHLEGISIPCNICDQTVRSRIPLKWHKYKHHTNSIVKYFFSAIHSLKIYLSTHEIKVFFCVE